MFVAVEIQGDKTPIVKFKQYLTCVAYGFYVGEVSERVIENLVAELMILEAQEVFEANERVVLVMKDSTQLNGFRVQTFGYPRTNLSEIDGIKFRFIPRVKPEDVEPKR